MNDLVTNEKIVTGLLAYAREQDPKRKIDHSFDWASCAVGEYARTINWQPTAVADVIELQNPTLWNVLDKHREARVHAATYGDLVTLIENCLDEAA